MSVNTKVYHFLTSVEWTKEHQGLAHVPGKPSIPVACPPVFCKGSPGEMWSPEEFFVSSYEVCVLLSFISQAKRNRVRFTSYTSEAKGKIEFVDKELMFSQITLKIRIEVPEDQNAEDVRKALADSKQRCLISASMKTAVKIEAEIVNVQPAV